MEVGNGPLAVNHRRTRAETRDQHTSQPRIHLNSSVLRRITMDVISRTARSQGTRNQGHSLQTQSQLNGIGRRTEPVLLPNLSDIYVNFKNHSINDKQFIN